MFLLAQGAIPDSRRTDGATPLWIAAQMGHDHVVKQLLKAGASVDAIRHVSFMWSKVIKVCSYEYQDGTGLSIVILVSPSVTIPLISNGMSVVEGDLLPFVSSD
jgi:ankyrin repeat protein